MSGPPLTAARAGLVACRTCGLLSRAKSDARLRCPRCGVALEQRGPASIQRTWALIVTAVILYIPANMLPVMVTQSVGPAHADTILGGVVRLYNTGSWPLALIVLIASVMIPLGKLLALAHLSLSVQRKSARNPRDRARLYRLVDWIGRWSMLDAFVATFVVALVQLGPLMSVKPGAGVACFMAVVILTMLAARSFDPRLTWDTHAEEKVQHV